MAVLLAVGGEVELSWVSGGGRDELRSSIVPIAAAMMVAVKLELFAAGFEFSAGAPVAVSCCCRWCGCFRSSLTSSRGRDWPGLAAGSVTAADRGFVVRELVSLDPVVNDGSNVRSWLG